MWYPNEREQPMYHWSKMRPILLCSGPKISPMHTCAAFSHKKPIPILGLLSNLHWNETCSCPFSSGVVWIQDSHLHSRKNPKKENVFRIENIRQAEVQVPASSREVFPNAPSINGALKPYVSVDLFVFTILVQCR